jgi:hypothetical protein
MFAFIRKLIVLAVFVLALVVAGKFFVEYKLQQQLDSQISSIAPFADISYQRIYLDSDGGVNLDGVEFSSPMMDLGKNSFDSLRLASENRWLFVLQALGLSEMSVPNALGAEIEGLELGVLSSDYLDQFIAVANEAFAAQVAPMCGDVQFLSISDIRNMGYGALTFDLKFNYAYSPVRSVVELSFDILAAEIGDTKGRVIFGGVPSLDTGAVMSAGKPSIQLIEVDYIDRGYTRKVNRYCSEKVGVSVEEYIDKEISREGEYFLANWGINPGIALREAYKEFLLDPRSINFAAYPSEDFDIEHLSLYAPKDWAGLLKLSLLVNDRAVSPIEFTLDAETTSDMLPLAEPAEPVVTEVAVKQFVEVTKKELENYKGYRMRVHSINGRMRQGIFTRVRNGNIEMTSEKYGSSVGVSVSVFSAEKIEIYK